VAAAAVSLVVGAYWLQKMTPKDIIHKIPISFPGEWIKTSFPLMVTQSLNLLLSQTSPIILGLIANATAVGLYSAAFRIAYLINFLPYAVSFVIAPIVAELYANGEIEKLQKILTGSVRITFLAGSGVMLIFIIFGNNLLLLFGTEFSAAFKVLIILMVGNLLDIAFGQSMIIMSMTGFQKAVAFIYGATSIINVVLNLILIPGMGFEGAAIASTICLIINRVSLYIYTRKKILLDPSVFRY
jgi:O-antigen/teichoic acid export membrane protein